MTPHGLMSVEQERREGVFTPESLVHDRGVFPESAHPAPFAVLLELDVLDEVDEPVLGQSWPLVELPELDWEVVVVVVVVDGAAKTAGAMALAAKTAKAVSISRIRLLRCIFSRLLESRLQQRLIRDFRELSLIVNGLLATPCRIVARCEEARSHILLCTDYRWQGESRPRGPGSWRQHRDTQLTTTQALDLMFRSPTTKPTPESSSVGIHQNAD